jgi:hypothetical protein
LAGAEPAHHPVPLFGLEPPVHQSDPELGPAGREALRHGAGRSEIGPLGLLDYRQHHIRLPPLAALPSHELQHPLALPSGPQRAPDDAAARWPVPQGGDVEIAVEREGE